MECLRIHRRVEGDAFGLRGPLAVGPAFQGLRLVQTRVRHVGVGQRHLLAPLPGDQDRFAQPLQSSLGLPPIQPSDSRCGWPRSVDPHDHVVPEQRQLVAIGPRLDVDFHTGHPGRTRGKGKEKRGMHQKLVFIGHRLLRSSPQIVTGGELLEAGARHGAVEHPEQGMVADVAYEQGPGALQPGQRALEHILQVGG